MGSASSSRNMATPSPSTIAASTSPSPTIVPCKRSQNRSKKASSPSFSDLPLSLLEEIMSLLVVKDNIRASAACKTWLEAASTVRVSEKHPWLLVLPDRGSLIKLHDPSNCKSYALDLPELANSTVFISNEVFFFNPFTKELISLPRLDLHILAIGFSCPPTLVFLAEKKGELFLMFTCGNKKPMVYKLVTDFEWEEMNSSNALDGLTIFVSLCNVELRSDLPLLRNRVCFSRFGNNRKRCVTYSFDENRFNTRKEWHSSSYLCPPQCLWFDPPKNVFDYL
ncbi:unnamed protein product, partial [Thlaspi arvense]